MLENRPKESLWLDKADEVFLLMYPCDMVVVTVKSVHVEQLGGTERLREMGQEAEGLPVSEVRN